MTISGTKKVENRTAIAPSGAITLSGFAFKLKDGAANKDMELSTTGKYNWFTGFESSERTE